MASSDQLEEKVPLEEAMKRLVNYNKENATRINKLENQIDELCRNFEEYRARHAGVTNEEIRNLLEAINEIQATNATFKEETNRKFEEIGFHWNNMFTDMKEDVHQILLKLNQVPEQVTWPSPNLRNEEQKVEEKEGNSDHKPRRVSRFTPECQFQFMGNRDNSTTTRATLQTPYLTQVESGQRPPILTTPFISQMKPSIIVPPSSAAPAFYGKSTESPTQFLIRVQEYAESVHAWDRTTLVNGISQFLRDSALEWYCQLRLSHRRPQTWTEFEDLFLAQFNSPIRKAKQEQEWHECKQKENETINEFLVRLRALWREQKPKETEIDLVKHLLRRMRNDILTMIGVSHNASLDEVMIAAQEVEDIIYRRAKGERLAKQIKQVSSSSKIASHDKGYDEENSHQSKPWRNREEGYYRRARHQQVNVITPQYDNNYQRRTTNEANQTRPLESPNCFRCGKYGHWARDCFAPDRAQRLTHNSSMTKNFDGALEGRTSHAPM